AWSAWRICFGRWRNGLRTLAATSAATAVVVGVLVAAGSTFGHGAGTGIKFAVFPLAATLVFSVSITVIRLGRLVVSRAYGGVKMYWRNLARDLRKIVARHRTDKSEISPKGFSKSFFVTIA